MHFWARRNGERERERNCSLNHKVTRDGGKKKGQRQRKDFLLLIHERQSALQNLPRPKAPPKLSISSPEGGKGDEREGEREKFVIR